MTPNKQAILDAINKIRKEAADEGLVDKYALLNGLLILRRLLLYALLRYQ